MSESKQQWTPGPWTLTTVPTSVGICHKIGPFPPSLDGGKPRHACLYADYPSDSNPADQELLANAKLIEAAPELVEALRRTLQLLTDMGAPEEPEDAEVLEAARAALAKAGA
ncbi:hypothetical protein [Burkholderia gladioli]|uniref:hypothetical protein n=1 Tax=Burkholderia gladioli TaxID=28095 RepID=UPI000F53D5F1|nr:hypothetical protein [Burkholderia gladioli]